MRRQVTSALSPIARALPWALVDGILVVMAYLVAFRLRFGSGVPPAYQDLLDSTVVWVSVVSIALLAAFGAYRRRTLGRHWAYRPVFEAMAIATLATSTVIAVTHQVRSARVNGASVLRLTDISLPPAVIVLFLLLALALLDGRRLLTNRTARA